MRRRPFQFSPQPLIALLAIVSPLLAGCSGASDLLSRDAEWFSRPGRLFIRNVSIDAAPLTPDRAVTADDLISADGGCPGMPPSAGPSDANALSDPNAPVAATRTGTVALGHTECDIARGVGMPDNVALSSNPRGDRVAVLTYSRGSRAGIYTFTAGRLTSIERGAEPAPQAKPARAKKRAAG